MTKKVPAAILGMLDGRREAITRETLIAGNEAALRALAAAIVALAVALVGGGLLYLMRRWTYKYALHFGEEYQRFYQEASALGAESIAGGVEIRLFGAMDRINKQIAELHAKLQAAAGLTPSVS